MLNNIKVNLNALEYMNFFWQSVMDNEKVGESYIAEVAVLPDMAYLYDGEFDGESVRKVLSAITNKELLNTTIKKEKRFWNNNMWVTEDRDMLNAMLQPIKSLNLDGIKDSVNKSASFPYETVEVIFLPAGDEECFQRENRLVINFFKVMVDIFGGTGKVTIMGKELSDYVLEKILEMK